MTNLAHIAEIGLLVLAAYLAGCVLGYAARRILHAARGPRRVAAAPSSAPPRPMRSAAARLAATVEEPLQLSAPKPRRVVPPGRDEEADTPLRRETG